MVFQNLQWKEFINKFILYLKQNVKFFYVTGKFNFLDKLLFQSIYFEDMKINIEELHNKAEQLFQEGNYAEAEPILKEIISSNPKFADVHNKLGMISHLNGNYRQAVDYFKKALEINPNYTEASLNLVVTYNNMGEFEKAKDVFAMAAQRAHPTSRALDPFIAGKIANEHFKLGNIYLDFGLNDEAIEEYRKAIKLFHRLPDVHTKLGIALRNKGNIEEAIQHFNTARELNPNYGQALVQLGLSYYMKGLTRLAFEHWEKALKINPKLKEAETYLSLFKKGEK